MYRFCVPALIIAGVLAAPATGLAQGGQAGTSSADAQNIRVGATIFYDYTYQGSPKATDSDGNRVPANGFDVKRTYINIRGNINRLLSFRITPDIKRETGDGSSLEGSLNFRLKYGYVEYSLADYLPSGSRVRMGIHQTPFIESQEGVYRYRFQGTVFAERDGGMSSADAGFSVRSVLPKAYGDVQIGLYNGEGYSKAEANNQKSLQLRATIRPLPAAEGAISGLRVTGFYDFDHTLRDAPRRRFLASALFEHDRFNAGFDYMATKNTASAAGPQIDGKGVSFFITPFVERKGEGLEGLLRIDRYDENVDAAGSQNRVIVGAAYWFPHPGGSATAAVLLDYEQVSFSNVTGRPTQKRLALHGLINF